MGGGRGNELCSNMRSRALWKKGREGVGGTRDLLSLTGAMRFRSTRLGGGLLKIGWVRGGRVAKKIQKKLSPPRRKKHRVQVTGRMY